MGAQRKRKHKKWNDARSRKLQTKWYGREERIRGQGKVLNTQLTDIHFDREHQLVAKIPPKFSFVYNTEETTEYFNNIVNVIKQKIFNQQFYIDASSVEIVTTEALIYIIAIVYNIKANRALRYSFTGNLPINKTAREVFEKSGYLNYFRMKRLKMPDSSECVQIVSGDKVETQTAKKMCDFVIEKLNIEKSKISVLYATLVELMSNTAKHAYSAGQKEMVESWYLYAMHENDKVTFSFVDTGQGIPYTIKKKFWEKIDFIMEDANLIRIALTEHGRSETKLPNRGKGLPKLYEQVQQGLLDDFFVLSGAGSCAYCQDRQQLELSDYPHKTYGTIFSFSIKKE